MQFITLSEDRLRCKNDKDTEDVGWSRSEEIIWRRRWERNVFLSDSQGDEDYVEVNEDYPDSDPDDPDANESGSDDWPKHPQKKNTGDGWEGKGKIAWWKKDSSRMQGRIHSSNIIKFKPGLNGPALHANSPEELWGVFTTPEIIGVLVEHANSIIRTKKNNYAQSCRTDDTDDVEMKALTGLLM